MLESIVETAIEDMVTLGIDIAKEKYQDRTDIHKLKKALTEYIEREWKHNEAVALSEEIDFHGLVAYIRNDLLEDAETRVFSPNKKNRAQARQQIIDKACSWAKAETDQARHRVSKSIAICLDIIRDFYLKGVSKKDCILSAEIADAVIEADNDNTERVLAEVKSNTQTILDFFNNNSLYSLDKAVQYVQEGHIDQVETGIKAVLNSISVKHPLFPAYGYDYSHRKIVSKPLTEEAKRRYPERYKITGTLKIGGQYFNDPNGNPMDYAYRHQLSIVMEVTKAVRYLGDRIDPIQEDLKNLTELRADPPPFPPAFACAVKVGDNAFFEYILLRVKEIMDDGRILLNNDEQNSHVRFALTINPAKPQNPDFKITISDADNKERLNYIRFMKSLQEQKDLHIYVLEEGEDLIAGYINDFKLCTGFFSIEEELDFLERICDIENYFNVVLKPESEINNEEYNAVIVISDLIRQEEVKGTWDDVTFTGTIDQHLREELMKMEDVEHCFSYVGTHCVNLFGAEFEFPFMQTLKHARFDNLEKIKKKLEVLDDGDSIRITFVSGEDKTCIETIRIPEQFEESI